VSLSVEILSAAAAQMCKKFQLQFLRTFAQKLHLKKLEIGELKVTQCHRKRPSHIPRYACALSARRGKNMETKKQRDNRRQQTSPTAFIPHAAGHQPAAAHRTLSAPTTSNSAAPLVNTLEIYDYLLQHGAHAIGSIMGKRDVIHKTGST